MKRLFNLWILELALIKAKNEGLDPFKTIEAVMPWNKIM